MDAEGGEALLVEDVDPEAGERGVDEEEEEVDAGEGGRAGGEVVAAGVFRIDVVHGGSDVHRDLELREAVGEDEGELAGIEFGEEDAEGAVGGGELVEGVDELDEPGLEGAGDLSVL